jgi:hypothetical protein
MPIEIIWDNDHRTILRLDFEGSWAWKDYDHAIEDAYHRVQEVTHTVDVMLNLLYSDPVPPLKSLKSFQRTLSQKPANVRTFVAVSNDTFACGLCVSFLKALAVSTLEQARALLANRAEPVDSEAAA